MVVVDREQRIVAANRRYLDAFGDRRAAVIGTPCAEVLRCPEAAARRPGRALRRPARCSS